MLMQALLGTIGQQGGIIQQAQANAQQGQQADDQHNQNVQNLALSGQQQTINDQQIAAGQQQVADQQAYSADVADWTSKGAPKEGLSNLIAKYPKQFQALQDSWKAKSADQAQGDLRVHGAIYSALNAGSTDVAIKELQARRDAEAKTGGDTTELDENIAELRSGNPAAIAAVKGAAQAHIAAAAAAAGDPKLAEAAGVDFEGNRYKAVSGQGVLDQQTGQWVPRPEGGDPASDVAGGGGSAPGGKRSMGWTPSTADGGDNAPSIVSAKIATLSKAIGVDPNAPLTLQQVRSLSAAIAPTEGGPGSVADRNNNPTNIRDGSFAKAQPGYVGKGNGGYAKFDTKASGDAAAQSLLAHYYARGQRTITDIIAGKPSGAPAQAPNPAANQSKYVSAYGKAPYGLSLGSRRDAGTHSRRTEGYQGRERI